jgi:hypothetical protein
MKVLIWVAAIVAALSIIISLILYISVTRQVQNQTATEEAQ